MIVPPKPLSLVWEDGWEGWEEPTTKAIYGALTKDYAWMGLSAFDAFQDGQTEA